MEIVQIIKEAGGDVTKTVMSHLDRTIFEYDGLVELAKTGCILEHDFFGIEVSHYQNNPKVDFLSDAQRIYRIKHLIDNGFEDQLVIAHDVHTRHRLVSLSTTIKTLNESPDEVPISKALPGVTKKAFSFKKSPKSII